MPCTARAAISAAMLGASAHATDANRKIPIEASSNTRRPQRSLSLPRISVAMVLASR